jgi:hypothetical protein
VQAATPNSMTLVINNRVWNNMGKSPLMMGGGRT